MLRRAVASDARALADIFAASRAEAMPWLPVLHSPAEDRTYLARAIAEHEVWLAVVDGEAAGFAVLQRHGFLDHFYVHPRFQRRGIGSALFERAKRSLTDGFRFWVFQANERARRFYKRRGAALGELTDGAGNEERTPDALYEWLPGGEAGARPAT